MTFVRCTDRKQRVDALRERLADPDQDAGRERDVRPSRILECLEANCWPLVGCTEVGHPPHEEPLRRGFEHHALAHRHRPESVDLIDRERSGVGVGQQRGGFEHRSAGGHQVVDRGVETHGLELVTGDPVLAFGPLAECEQGLLAPRGLACSRDLEHFVDRHESASAGDRWVGERAVPTRIPAQLCKGDEDLLGERDARAGYFIPQSSGRGDGGLRVAAR